MYSSNQVRHLYVVNDVKDSFAELENPGDICVGKDISDGLYFQYYGAIGNKSRSDLVNIKTLKASATPSDDDKVVLKGFKLTLSDDCNGGVPLLGALYTVQIHLNNFIAASDEYSYYKYGNVRGTSNMSASDFYKLMAYDLVLNAKKEACPLYCVYIIVGGSETLVDPALTFKQVYDLGDAEGIVIYEAEQKWSRLRFHQQKLPLIVNPRPVHVAGEPVKWWELEEVDSDKYLPQGQRVAELEVFAMGERGDIYRLVGWPDAIVTNYLVDPTKEYDFVNLHYAFIDEGENSYRSEKDIQLACINDGSHTVANALIGAINTAAGTEIATL